MRFRAEPSISLFLTGTLSDSAVSSSLIRAEAQLKAALKTTVSLQLSVSLERIFFNVSTSMSEKDSASRAMDAWASITSQQRCIR
uniref:Uncharacterized protein n=1 Tax=Lepeophtheirus salmonis TaxID=72036 RepID=A0A0K2TD71_LEPSM